MPSHLKEAEPLPDGITVSDVRSNGHADRLAGEAANRAVVPLHISSPVLIHTNQAKCIQHRLATIIMNLPSREKSKPVQKSPIERIAISTMLETTSHVIHVDEDAGRAKCARCHSSFKLKDPNLRAWLNCKCECIGTPADRPTKVPLGELHVGNQRAHSSHNLYRFRGLSYCFRCGMRGVTKFHKLAHPCQPPTDFGNATRRALQEGNLPPKLYSWPE
jgi:hypothetical protein